MTTINGPIFIMGFPRSGTTGLASGLSQLPGFPPFSTEGHFLYLFRDAIERIQANKVNPNCILRDEAAKKAFFNSISEGADRAYRASAGGEPYQWIDKTPDVQQVKAIPSIYQLFPDAWYFYIYRDPINAVRSNMATWPEALQGKEFAIAERWIETQKTWRENRTLLPADKTIEIYQPTLRDNPEEIVETISAKMNLPESVSGSLLSFWAANRAVNRPTGNSKAKKYDKFDLSFLKKRRIKKLCSDEVSHWPKIVLDEPR